MGKAEDFQIDETTLARDYGSGSAIEIPQGVETIAAGFLLHDYLISYDNLFDIRIFRKESTSGRDACTTN